MEKIHAKNIEKYFSFSSRRLSLIAFNFWYRFPYISQLRSALSTMTLETIYSELVNVDVMPDSKLKNLKVC